MSKFLRTCAHGILAIAATLTATSLLYVAARHTSWLVFVIMTCASIAVWGGVTAIVRGVRRDQAAMRDRFAERRVLSQPEHPDGRDVLGTHRPGIDPPPSRDR